MRRTSLALVGLLLMVTLLVSLKSSPVAALLGWSAESDLAPEVGGEEPAPEGDLPSIDPGSAATATAAPGAPPTSDPGTGQTAAPPTRSATTAPPAGPSGTVTGDAVAVRTAQAPSAKSKSCRECADYTISVTITVSNGRITATSVAYNPSPGESQSYASSANTKLRSKLLAASAQTWNLGRVSGATYSGNAWELSLKSAMSKIGLPT